MGEEVLLVLVVESCLFISAGLLWHTSGMIGMTSTSLLGPTAYLAGRL